MHGLVVGRLQPLHNGHQRLIRDALKECDTLTVLLGSTDKRDERNPWTESQRREMVKAAFPVEVALGVVRVLGQPDVGNDAGWLAAVRERVGPFDRVYGNDAYTLRIFEAAGIPVIRPGLHRRAEWEATKVRDLIHYGDPAWQDAVPAAVARLIRIWGAA